MAKTKNDETEVLWTKSDLKARGWTDTLIHKLLGDPDETKKNPRYRSSAPMQLFNATRVQQAENNELFAINLAASEKRKLAAAQGVRTRIANERSRLKAHTERCKRLGIHDPSGRVASMLLDGVIDEDLAELLAFVAKYRHEHTDYDNNFDRYDADDFESLRADGDYVAIKELAAEQKRHARESKKPCDIPADWDSYLAKFRFTSAVASAIAQVLKDPLKCAPIWFKKAEVAVRRARLPLEDLTYERIVAAIEAWPELKAKKK